MAINQYGIKERKVKKKSYAKSNTAKKKPYKMVPDDRSGRHSKKKVYAGTDFPKAREDARKNTAKARPFGEAFKAARVAKKDKFLWKGKSYHTKTKDELEKKIGTSEKERFERKGKSNQATKKRSFLDKIKSFGGSSKGGDTKAKRIAWMEKRKEAGKSYSKKNLAALKAK
tara:strand:+ start:71 stop:583 length:513 start_codon:yes stop_codon:yes gene_type:complete